MHEFGLPPEESHFSVWQIVREEKAPFNFQSVSYSMCGLFRNFCKILEFL